MISTQAGPPVFSFNLGECSYDDAGIDEVLRKMEADYNEAVFVRVVNLPSRHRAGAANI